MLIVNTAGDARLNWRTFPLKWSALNIYSFYSDNFWINSRRVERNAIKTCNNQRNPIKTFSLFFNIQPSSKIIRVSSELKWFCQRLQFRYHFLYAVIFYIHRNSECICVSYNIYICRPSSIARIDIINNWYNW